MFVYLALVRKNNSCRDETGLALNWDAGCIFQQAVTCGERPGRRVGVTRSGRINITETTRQLWVAPKDANYGAKVEINTSERKWRRTYKNTQEKRSQITVGLFFPPSTKASLGSRQHYRRLRQLASVSAVNATQFLLFTEKPLLWPHT